MISVTSVYNNISGAGPFKSGWGSSSLISAAGEKVLFDTGPDSGALLFNLRLLNIDPKSIGKIAISHRHDDHAGGLTGVLKENKGRVDLFLPDSYAKDAEAFRPYCRSVTIVSKEKSRIAGDVYTSGTCGLRVREQALVIDAPAGLVVVTGCAHPGIVMMCKSIRKEFNKDIYAVLGGLHFEYIPAFMAKMFFRSLKNMGVKKAGANHCSGERAIEISKDIFKDGFVDLSLGRTFTSG